MGKGKQGYSEAKILYEKGIKLLEEKLARKKEKSRKKYIKRYRRQIIAAYYNLACCYAVVDKDKKRALDALEKAIEYGWSDYKHTIEDEDLKILRGEKRFKNLLNKMRSF
jgi:tetratricopeptide (TPR) repeat protein